MAESGLGVSVLPQLVLRRIPYRAAIRPFFSPAYRDIVPALRSKKSVPLALKHFFDDLPFRFPAARLKGKHFSCSIILSLIRDCISIHSVIN